MIIFKPHKALAQIKPYLPENPIIIEAGAFDGRETKKMAHMWPQGIIHAFEPVPEIYEQLKVNTAYLANVHCYPLALSDQNGTAPFYVSEKAEKPGIPSQAGSLREPKERLQWSPLQFPYTIEAPTVTLDTWAAQYEIDTIDMLWLDMQGHELTVLKSISKELFNSIKVIYIEVAFIEAYAGQPTYQTVKSWLERKGFQEIGRDFVNETDWFFGNCLFVRIQ